MKLVKKESIGPFNFDSSRSDNVKSQPRPSTIVPWRPSMQWHPSWQATGLSSMSSSLFATSITCCRLSKVLVSVQNARVKTSGSAEALSASFSIADQKNLNKPLMARIGVIRPPDVPIIEENAAENVGPVDVVGRFAISARIVCSKTKISC
jgi:hypothetical protein